MRKGNYFINFLNGQRIFLVDRFVFSQREEDLRVIWNILVFMRKRVSELVDMRNVPEEMDERLKVIDQELMRYEEEREVFRVEINGIECKKKPDGFLIFVECREFYRAVLSIYMIYDKSVPTADLVFFCYLSTSWQELKMFINRCCLNKKTRSTP